MRFSAAMLVACCLVISTSAKAQIAPSSTEISTYLGLHAAAQEGNAKLIRQLISLGRDVELKDSYGRTPLHVAVFGSHANAVKALAESKADLNALENDAYDAITIAAVANDVEMIKLLLSLGANSGNITSPYDGTALIAAAHLGHFEVVRILAEAGAPLDHVNNLGWTALIEAVVLGDGGPRHVKTSAALIEAGADISVPDRQGVTPLEHARSRGYTDMVARFPQVSE